ncbi:MAG TPA: hypothetical protein DHW78_03620 [Ruminococcaceae bacterium]|jgi:hypothetical protein|nr:hypothetical protein [Oscillospiraceae bacterium]
MSNREKCITLLNNFDENQLASIAVFLQTAKNKAVNIDTHKKIIPILKSDFSKKSETEKRIKTEIAAYRKELEAEKTSQTSLHLENSGKES